MLEVTNLNFKYSDKTILNNVSFSLEENKIGALIGFSGSGKTTLIKILCGILKSESGSVKFNNDLLSTKNKIGYVSQDFGLYNWKTVLENILLGIKIKKIPLNKNLFEEIVETLNIKNLLHKKPKLLSGGEKQRVSLARSFLMSPDILVLDEPFSALDEITKIEAYKLFKKSCKSFNITTLFVTHSIDEAIFLSDKIFLLSNEKIETLDSYKIDLKKYILSRLEL